MCGFVAGALTHPVYSFDLLTVTRSRTLGYVATGCDRSFITDILTDPEDLALASAIVAMAHSLGMQVIAEGIKTKPQYSLMRARGCDLAQGFWMSAAVPPDQLAQHLKMSAMIARAGAAS